MTKAFLLLVCAAIPAAAQTTLAAKGPLPILVIDHVERPSEN